VLLALLQGSAPDLCARDAPDQEAANDPPGDEVRMTRTTFLTSAAILAAVALSCGGHAATAQTLQLAQAAEPQKPGTPPAQHPGQPAHPAAPNAAGAPQAHPPGAATAPAPHAPPAAAATPPAAHPAPPAAAAVPAAPHAPAAAIAPPVHNAAPGAPAAAPHPAAAAPGLAPAAAAPPAAQRAGTPPVAPTAQTPVKPPAAAAVVPGVAPAPAQHPAAAAAPGVAPSAAAPPAPQRAGTPPVAPTAQTPPKSGAPAAAAVAPGVAPAAHPAPAAAAVAPAPAPGVGRPAPQPAANATGAIPAAAPRPTNAYVAPPVTRPVDPAAMPHRLDAVRAERQEVQEGNRTIIREQDRVIIREGGHDIIRHDEAARFAFNAREVNVEHRGDATVTIAVRPDGSRIVTEVDGNGRLLRRLRRDAFGREIIIIDNTVVAPVAVIGGPAVAIATPGLAVGFGGLGIGVALNLGPPVVRIAPELYVRETAVATPAQIYMTLAAPPVEVIDRRYSLDEIRYNEPLRARMPRVDIDTVNFETGSWEIAPDQAQRLAGVAQGMLQAVQRNPAEVFLIEGHTDAVGNDVDNLSLSDHRAESVAVLLTNQFGVPAENLTSQGYGKQFLKVPSPGPERANRRVAVRRITPLLTAQAQ
jgi:outer membrane protein OmpA-like peptidoglycan-associated protein